MAVIAHVSDTHVDDGQRSVDRTRAVLEYLEELPGDLDALMITGDVADHGKPDEYERFRGLLGSRHPTLICPGNHDARGAFREHLLGEPASESPINRVHRAPGLVIALIDSSVPGEDYGGLEEETLAWLDGVLAETPDEVPVLVGFHHPPARLHVPFIDGIRLFGEEGLAERRSRITAYLCGHAHTAAATTYAGRPLLVAPGVVSTLRLPWEKRSHPEDHLNFDQPPALAFHILDGDGRLTTHFRTVPL